MTAPRVLLYSKPGCHLCEITQQLLLGLRREFEFEIQPVDITQDPVLFERYREQIPVVVVEGEAPLTAPVRVADVRAALVHAFAHSTSEKE